MKKRKKDILQFFFSLEPYPLSVFCLRYQNGDSYLFDKNICLPTTPSIFSLFFDCLENEENNFWGKRKEEKINKYLKTNIAIAKLNSKIKVFSQTIWKKKFDNRDIFLCMKKCCQKYKKKNCDCLLMQQNFIKEGTDSFII